MLNKQSGILLNSMLNGSFQKGNFIWGGAMNICWNTLSQSIIKEPLKLQVNTNLGQHLIENFKLGLFSKKDLSEESYYTKAGFGPSTLQAINKEVKLKFPNKTFNDIQLNLSPRDIISYSYFHKQVQYLHPFSLLPSFYFLGSRVRGFRAKTPQHFDNIRVCNYTNNNQFILKLLLKQQNEELFIVKGREDSLPQDVVEAVLSNADNDQRLGKQEKFQMPIVDIDIKREYTELVDAPLLNTDFQDYKMGAMFESIKFKIDEVGAKVENEAVMAVNFTIALGPPKRNFIVNSSFWVLMRQVGCYPYFVAQINNAEFMLEDPEQE